MGTEMGNPNSHNTENSFFVGTPTGAPTKDVVKSLNPKCLTRTYTTSTLDLNDMSNEDT